MKPAAKKMTEKTEYEKAYDRIKANAGKVDVIAHAIPDDLKNSNRRHYVYG